MRRPLGLCLLLAALVSCGHGPGEDAAQTRAYMAGLGTVLQRLRATEAQIAAAVPADSVRADAILPLIEGRFLPALRGLRTMADGLHPTARLQPVHAQLVAYLGLRVQAFELARDGARSGRPDLLARFAQAQNEADRAGRVLQQAILQARAGTPP